MSVILITGASRGIGLEFTKQYIERGDSVIAVCRKSNPALEQTGAEIIEGIDVAQAEDISKLQVAMNGRKIDILVNNAGVLHSESLDQMNFDNILNQFQVNSMGPLRVTHALLESLDKGSKVAIVSSRMGSVEDNSSGGYYGYRMSKSAVNSVGKSLSVDLHPQGVAVAVLHPGYVRTEMTGGQGEINADQSAKGLIKVIDKLNLSNSGSFWHTNGSSLPW
tara:strand:+ start:126 stop:788 length:663 start_codon:yes stop_codon:yes gene_type:complete